MIARKFNTPPLIVAKQLDRKSRRQGKHPQSPDLLHIYMNTSHKDCRMNGTSFLSPHRRSSDYDIAISIVFIDI